MTMNVAMIEIGMVTAGTSVARRLPRNRKITSSTTVIEMPSAVTTSRSDALMESARSMLMVSDMPAGSPGWMRSSVL